MAIEDAETVANTLRIVSGLLEEQPDDWLPVYAALLGAVAGGLVSILPTWLVERRRDKSFSRQVRNALISEVLAILSIIEQRKYVCAIDKVIHELEAAEKGSIYSFTVQIPDHYSRVYQNNTQNLGVLPGDISRDIIVFHQLLDAVAQDIRPGGVLSEGGQLREFLELRKILIRAVEVGNSLQMRAATH